MQAHLPREDVVAGRERSLSVTSSQKLLQRHAKVAKLQAAHRVRAL